MKKIIVLLGKSNTGKTTTIMEVYKQLTKNTPAVVAQNGLIKSLGGKPCDYEGSFTYNGKKVGFCSRGDAKYYVGNVVDAYTFCDVLVVPVNPSNYNSVFINMLEKTEEIRIVKKNQAEPADNKRALNDIINLI